MKITTSISFVCALSFVELSGCKDLTGTQNLPAGVQGPVYFSTPGGAIGMRNAADSLFESALMQYVRDAGLLSDELQKSSFIGTNNGIPIPVNSSLDQRILFPESDVTPNGDATYNSLQQVRGAANQAIGALATYYPSASPALRGEMYAIQGYAEIMLADLFCSGIPLSTLDFNRDFTYKAASTKEQVYQDAITKFDTSLAISSDSDRIMNLARVGLGRAQLALGHYTEAAQAVASVPDRYRYQVMVQWRGTRDQGAGNALNGQLGNGNSIDVSNLEGGNGMLFISSGDPRTAVVNSFTSGSFQLRFPSKYQTGLTAPFYSPITLADGVEARLIQAEAALHVVDTVAWLSALNQLRTSSAAPTPSTVADTLGITGCNENYFCDTDGVSGGSFQIPAGYTFSSSFTIYPVSPALQSICSNYSSYATCYDGDSALVNVYVSQPYWHAGTGGVDSLPLLTDPGTDTGRVSLMFKERAYWLYLTGHRQGDLRRLIRQYGGNQSQVYPIGAYLPNGQGVYGNDVTVPIPSSENPNPLFHGCIDRNA